jgi:3-methyl-2-oxobutanoate hydroxymethyltransferase
MNKINLSTLNNKKLNGVKITALTAYDYPTAKLIDENEIDIILVGDSLGMVVLGYESTLQVTMEDMLHHLKAVIRGAANSFIIADMPFMSYGVSQEQTLNNAGKFMRAGAHCVKLEGASEDILLSIKKLSQIGIPVSGHLGFTPQSVNQLGGYKIQGKTKDSEGKIIQDALAIEKSGASLLVLEMVPAELAKKITERLSIPTIGIGAGKDCSGQILVTHDLIGLFDKFKPKFVKQYSLLNNEVDKAIKEYKQEVLTQKFPDKNHSY